MIVTDKPVRIEPAHPYSYSEEARNTYNYQNACLRIVGDFPRPRNTQRQVSVCGWTGFDEWELDQQERVIGDSFAPVGSAILDVYTDRISHEQWQEAVKALDYKQGGGFQQAAMHAPDANILTFARVAVGDARLTGVRIVRYTNVSSGYPVWRIDGYINPIAAAKKQEQEGTSHA